MLAFITGSYAYGKPNSKSDLDLVIRAKDSAIALLKEHGGVIVPDKGKDKNGNDYITIRFDMLNIVVCKTDEEYDLWDIGTCRLIKQKEETNEPISSKEAKAVFDKLRKELDTDADY